MNLTTDLATLQTRPSIKFNQNLPKMKTSIQTIFTVLEIRNRRLLRKPLRNKRKLGERKMSIRKLLAMHNSNRKWTPISISPTSNTKVSSWTSRSPWQTVIKDSDLKSRCRLTKHSSKWEWCQWNHRHRQHLLRSQCHRWLNKLGIIGSTKSNLLTSRLISQKLNRMLGKLRICHRILWRSRKGRKWRNRPQFSQHQNKVWKKKLMKSKLKMDLHRSQLRRRVHSKLLL